MLVPRPIVIAPDAIFDGRELRRGEAVLVRGDRIEAIGSDLPLGGAHVYALAGCTLLPGLIDLHTHVLLHPYDARPWADQVLRDPLALRVARAVVALRATLAAGFTTIRDLGTEGAGEADAGLRDAIAQGIVPGPHMVCVTRAIVARGSYGPAGFAPHVCVPQGAQEVDGIESIAAATRAQIRAGADWVKVYADYRYGPRNLPRPAFSVEELATIVRVATDAGCPVAAHATTREAMRRAALAGVATIEHGNDGDDEVFALMAQRGVAYVPTLAAYEAIARYRDLDDEDPAVEAKRNAFAAARRSGVTIANGSDIGVFPHGENARELELLVEHGMSPREALEAATATAARVLRCDDLGVIRTGAIADVIAVEGNPVDDIRATRAVRLVLREGQAAAP